MRITEPGRSQPDGRTRGIGNIDLRSLVEQAREWEAAADHLLERVGLGAGWRVVDVGCGPFGILEMLSAKVGPSGEVVGIEPDPGSADTAAAMVGSRALTNVRIVPSAANDRALPRDYFDLVHARSVVIQQENHREIVEQLVGLARPGGVVATQEVDGFSWLCEPPHPAWDALPGVLKEMSRRCQIDLYLGRKMARLLRVAGLEDVRVAVHVDPAPPGSYRRTHLLSLIESVEPTVVRQRLATAEQLADWSRDLRPHLDDADTVVLTDTLFQAWGRKPGPTTAGQDHDGPAFARSRS